MVQKAVSDTLIALSLLLTTTVSSSSATTNPGIQNLRQIQDYDYVVKTDDTFRSIAKNTYGSEDYWTTIWNDNPELDDPAKVEKDMKLKIRFTPPMLVEYLNTGLQKKYDEKEKAVLASSYLVPKQTITSSLPVNTQPVNFEDVYKAAGEKFGVPWQILYGLHATETGQRDGMIMNHSGSGARGPMQFMPGTWKGYAVDGNGDGTQDIDNAVDAIYGAANFMAKHGSIANGLRSYGGNTPGVLSLARSKGYSE